MPDTEELTSFVHPDCSVHDHEFCTPHRKDHSDFTTLCAEHSINATKKTSIHSMEDSHEGFLMGLVRIRLG